jgi:hypothetical protein
MKNKTTSDLLMRRLGRMRRFTAEHAELAEEYSSFSLRALRSLRLNRISAHALTAEHTGSACEIPIP